MNNVAMMNRVFVVAVIAIGTLSTTSAGVVATSHGNGLRRQFHPTTRRVASTSSKVNKFPRRLLQKLEHSNSLSEIKRRIQIPRALQEDEEEEEEESVPDCPFDDAIAKLCPIEEWVAWYADENTIGEGDSYTFEGDVDTSWSMILFFSEWCFEGYFDGIPTKELGNSSDAYCITGTDGYHFGPNGTYERDEVILTVTQPTNVTVAESYNYFACDPMNPPENFEPQEDFGNTSYCIDLCPQYFSIDDVLCLDECVVCDNETVYLVNGAPLDCSNIDPSLAQSCGEDDGDFFNRIREFYRQEVEEEVVEEAPACDFNAMISKECSLEEWCQYFAEDNLIGEGDSILECSGDVDVSFKVVFQISEWCFVGYFDGIPTKELSNSSDAYCITGTDGYYFGPGGIYDRDEVAITVTQPAMVTVAESYNYYICSSSDPTVVVREEFGNYSYCIDLCPQYFSINDLFCNEECVVCEDPEVYKEYGAPLNCSNVEESLVQSCGESDGDYFTRIRSFYEQAEMVENDSEPTLEPTEEEPVEEEPVEEEPTEEEPAKEEPTEEEPAEEEPTEEEPAEEEPVVEDDEEEAPTTTEAEVETSSAVSSNRVGSTAVVTALAVAIASSTISSIV